MSAARAHPNPRQYWMIALFLGVVTAIEVAVYYTGLSRSALVPIMIGLALVKFLTVIGFFMHLYFETKTFKQFFFIGLGGAIILYLVVIVTLS